MIQWYYYILPFYQIRMLHMSEKEENHSEWIGEEENHANEEWRYDEKAYRYIG